MSTLVVTVTKTLLQKAFACYWDGRRSLLRFIFLWYPFQIAK